MFIESFFEDVMDYDAIGPIGIGLHFLIDGQDGKSAVLLGRVQFSIYYMKISGHDIFF